MISVKVMLNSVEAVKNFVNEITKYDCDFDLGSSRIMIDAKSILGILSLGLKKPLDLSIHQTDRIDEVMQSIEPFIIY